MSNSVWHKPSETTDVDNNLIIDDWTNRTYELGYFDDNDMIFRNFRNDDTYFEESMMRWCDVNELIDDYDRTHKALKIAIDALERTQNKCRKAKMTEINYGKIDGIEAVATKATNEIKQLIKGE